MNDTIVMKKNNKHIEKQGVQQEKELVKESQEIPVAEIPVNESGRSQEEIDLLISNMTSRGWTMKEAITIAYGKNICLKDITKNGQKYG